MLGDKRQLGESKLLEHMYDSGVGEGLVEPKLATLNRNML
jgi:hypothetical protein